MFMFLTHSICITMTFLKSPLIFLEFPVAFLFHCTIIINSLHVLMGRPSDLSSSLFLVVTSFLEPSVLL